MLTISRILAAGAFIALVNQCSPGLLVDPGFERTPAAKNYLKEIR